MPEFYKRFLDPFVQLSVAAAVTERIRLGTGVVLVAERNPLELAKSVASLDVVSNGRVEVGVGYGWNPLEMANNGVNPALRRKVFREKLTAVRRLWTEETVAFDGRWVRFSDGSVVPQARAAAPPSGPDRGGGLRRHLRRRAGPGRRVLPQPGSVDLPDQVGRLAARAAGTAPAVTAVEMEGQRPGTPWYSEDGGRGRDLGERARRYAAAGVHRMSVGVPADDDARLARALEFLGSLAWAVR